MLLRKIYFGCIIWWQSAFIALVLNFALKYQRVSYHSSSKQLPIHRDWQLGLTTKKLLGGALLI